MTGKKSITLRVAEISIRPERDIPTLTAGYGQGQRGGSVYTRLVPSDPWEISVEVDEDVDLGSVDGVAAVAAQMYERMDLVLILAEGERRPAEHNYGGKEIRAR